MSLKKLNQFCPFDIKRFLAGIELVATGNAVWKDFESGAKRGTKVEAVIVTDKNKYQTADGEVVNNLYEKLVVKIPKEIDVPLNKEIQLINPRATVYGQFRNQLSITADDIEVVGK